MLNDNTKNIMKQIIQNKRNNILYLMFIYWEKENEKIEQNSFTFSLEGNINFSCKKWHKLQNTQTNKIIV